MLSVGKRNAPPYPQCTADGEVSSERETPLEQARKHAKPCDVTVCKRTGGADVGNTALVPCMQCGIQYEVQILTTGADSIPDRCPRCRGERGAGSPWMPGATAMGARNANNEESKPNALRLKLSGHHGGGECRSHSPRRRTTPLPSTPGASYPQQQQRRPPPPQHTGDEVLRGLRGGEGAQPEPETTPLPRVRDVTVGSDMRSSLWPRHLAMALE